MKTGWKIAIGAGVAAVAAIAAVGVWKWPEIQRARFVASMFSGQEQVERFRNMDAYFPVRAFRRGGPVSDLPQGETIDLPATYAYGGETRDTQAFLADTDTTGLMAVSQGRVVYENYRRGNDRDTRWISWSVGKSFISALIGIAVEEGHIASIDDKLVDYAPELKGTSYDGVTIRNALEMSSGVAWNEDYSDPDSDISRFGRALAFGSSMVEFAKTLGRANEPGTVNLYNSLDAQMLGLVLLRATGESPSEYLEDRIWSKIGAEHDGYWVLDDTGMELAAGGVNVTLRDYARFGLLYLNGGKWNGERIVPADWVKASHTPDAPRLMPGKQELSDTVWGYGYLWWLPRAADGPFAAVGIYNQFIYVDPAQDLVIVKTSANSDYGRTNEETSFREDETIALFEAMAAKIRAGN
ncbi:CubicO group peptidase (beta-lactamase class C family) [Parvibaculum indicum]|uniref:serine hydrolase domain-containing protein n=1 Tax=Parvibaculum indicum TaxID=562969 RepID=UPI00142466F5|nr:serine hydrolase [Parvibaculum indicum]NIJ41743.1 CubicO group peptidase (beta-lactamase class C family) [Parvibaculum indicum]